MDPEAPNVLHTLSRRANWSRANEKGVFPGVSTPLNWSIWGEIGERSVRRAAWELGLLDEQELAPPVSVDDWMWSIFYGRPAANVDCWRMLYERGLAEVGGGEAVQRQVFGEAPSSECTPSSTGRRDEIARRRPRVLAETPVRLRAIRAEVEAWWREATSPTALRDADGARTCFATALDWFERADRDHILVSLLATQAMTAVSSASERAGLSEVANALMIGYPGMEEFRTTVALWDLSRGRISLDAFLAEHGFHGPGEGEIESRSWRERPEPVLALARHYDSLHETDDPRLREERSIEKRQRLERELRAAVEPGERSALDDALTRTATFLPLRESGRATLTLALDAMRAAARVLGKDLARNGLLHAPEEAFLLTRGELLEPRSGLAALTRARRQLRETYASFDLPETWQGMPDKRPLDGSGAGAPGANEAVVDAGARLEGLGASAGVHEGVARVVLDPVELEEDFDPGDVLVAPATDPSWAPLFLVAGAVVIDTGSNISHAAVVAREMGIPAVVSVSDASRRLRSGQKLRVDGGTGTVEVLA
jgi:pyruvate,water dikinase